MVGMSLEEPPKRTGIVNGEVACDTELEHEEITLAVPKLCLKSYTWPFFGAPDAATQMLGTNSGHWMPSPHSSSIPLLYDSCNFF